MECATSHREEDALQCRQKDQTRRLLLIQLHTVLVFQYLLNNSVRNNNGNSSRVQFSYFSSVNGSKMKLFIAWTEGFLCSFYCEKSRLNFVWFWIFFNTWKRNKLKLLALPAEVTKNIRLMAALIKRIWIYMSFVFKKIHFLPQWQYINNSTE